MSPTPFIIASELSEVVLSHLVTPTGVGISGGMNSTILADLSSIRLERVRRRHYARRRTPWSGGSG